jgi:hypothetical protein
LASRPVQTERQVVSAASVDVVDELVAAAVSRDGVGPRALRLQALLHLPRIASPSGMVPAALAVREIDRLALLLTAEIGPCHQLAAPPRRLPKSPRELKVGPVPSDEARVIQEHFHYLRSWRPDTVAFAACFDERVAALASVAPLDVEPIIASLPARLDADDVAVVARTFAFDWAPRNTITYLLARVGRALAEHEKKQMLVTYLNPNLGFTGASYKAANWTLYAHECGTRYAYLDRNYITDRKLRERYGTADPVRLQALLGSRIAFSRMHLRPLELYALGFDPRIRDDLASRPQLELKRPKL